MEVPTHRIVEVLLVSMMLTSTSGSSHPENRVYREACGGTFGGTQGEVVSPHYPQEYGYNMDCVYNITVPDGYHVHLTFSDFHLDASFRCSYDYVEILQIGRYCGKPYLPKVTSSQNQLTLRFHSDGYLVKRGFKASYKAVHGDGCGGTFEGTQGLLSSSNSPQDSQDDVVCNYTITVPEFAHMELTVTDLQLEDCEDCSGHCSSYVQVYDGANAEAGLLGQFCGQRSNVKLAATGNVMFIRFVADGSLTYTFHAKYSASRAGCGGVFTDPQGFLMSPNFPSVFPSEQLCDYYITVSPGHRINLTFRFFSMRTCSWNFLKVFDGGKGTTEQGDYCGYDLPGPVTSSGNTMYLRFEGDDSEGGFLIHYTEIPATQQ